MNIKSLFFLFYKIGILLLIFSSMHAWFLWPVSTVYLAFSVSILTLLFLFFSKIRLHFSSKQLLGFLLLTFASIIKSDLSLNGVIGIVSLLFPAFIFLAIDSRYSKDVWAFIRTSFFYLFIASILLHIILLFYPFPSPFVISNSASPNYVFGNYFILIKNYILYSDRFCSIFLEPGYLGAFLAFYFYVEKYDFSKKENRVALLALIFSFSLAGYLLTGIGFFIYMMSSTSFKSYSSKLIIFSFLLYLSYMCIQNYDDGNNLLNKLIVERLDVDKEKGIKGNNRVTEKVDEYFDYALSNGKIWFGLGNEYLFLKTGEDRAIAAGYKDYLLSNGLFNALLVAMAYLFLALSGYNKKYSLGFYVLIFLCFIQASYPLSSSWIVPFFVGLKCNK